METYPGRIASKNGGTVTPFAVRTLDTLINNLLCTFANLGRRLLFFFFSKAFVIRLCNHSKQIMFRKVLRTYLFQQPLYAEWYENMFS